jgi:hypothetical protein
VALSDVALVSLFVFAIVVPIVTAIRERKANQRYLPGDADIYAVAEPRTPFTLEIPPGPALDVMLRYRVDRVGRTGGGTAGYGFTILVEATREQEGAGGFREAAKPFELRHERVIGTRGKPIGEAPLAPGEPSYAVVRHGTEESRTSIIARLPAGGAGVVRGRIEGEMLVSDFVLFAKPS